jgi:hypothetical protein
MIDQSKIDGQKLISMMLDDTCGNYNAWWRLVEFVDNYTPRFLPDGHEITKVSIKCGESYLRRFGRKYIWDFHYGKDSEFGTHENALICLMDAPVPPWLLKRELIWVDSDKK